MKKFLSWLALLELVAVIAAIVRLVHPYTPDLVGFVGHLILWPALINPRWLGLIASIGAFLLVGVVAAAVPDGDEDKATESRP